MGKRTLKGWQEPGAGRGGKGKAGRLDRKEGVDRGRQQQARGRLEAGNGHREQQGGGDGRGTMGWGRWRGAMGRWERGEDVHCETLGGGKEEGRRRGKRNGDFTDGYD